MSNTNTGGPAFPPSNPGYAHGMTLRDYFAAQALSGLISTEANLSLKPNDWAKEAYMIADAMLKARGQ